MPPEIQPSTVTVPLECQYLLRVPEPLPSAPLIAITLHGYGMDAQSMLRLTAALLGPETVIASIQAPNQHYLGSPSDPDRRIGYNWGIPRQFSSAIRLHHAILNVVIAELRGRFSVDATRILLIGFSQPVSFNYRYVATCAGQVGGVMAICGGVPGDWETAPYRPFSTPVLHIARSEDEAYPKNLAMKFPERLRQHASNVEFHMIPGAHRFPSKAGAIVEPWLERVFGS
jgi:predicted esterase